MEKGKVESNVVHLPTGVEEEPGERLQVTLGVVLKDDPQEERIPALLLANLIRDELIGLIHNAEYVSDILEAAVDTIYPDRFDWEDSCDCPLCC